MIGALLILLAVACLGNAVVKRDWDLLGQILLFAGAFTVALGLVVGIVWMLVKIFIRKHSDDTKVENGHDSE